MSISPDTKDWTWVTERACPECGFDASVVALTDVPRLLLADTARWPAVLDRPDVTTRPDAGTWSALEYGAHVRDALGVFTGRFARMVAEDDPLLANWDQDAAAVAGRYGEQDPRVVADELVAAGEILAAALEAIPADAASRTAQRSDGSQFTVESLARYLLHDVVHHLWDVTHQRS